MLYAKYRVARQTTSCLGAIARHRPPSTSAARSTAAATRQRATYTRPATRNGGEHRRVRHAACAHGHGVQRVSERTWCAACRTAHAGGSHIVVHRMSSCGTNVVRCCPLCGQHRLSATECALSSHHDSAHDADGLGDASALAGGKAKVKKAVCTPISAPELTHICAGTHQPRDTAAHGDEVPSGRVREVQIRSRCEGPPSAPGLCSLQHRPSGRAQSTPELLVPRPTARAFARSGFTHKEAARVRRQSAHGTTRRESVAR